MPWASKTCAPLPLVLLKLAVPALGSTWMPATMVVITVLRSPAWEMAANKRP